MKVKLVLFVTASLLGGCATLEGPDTSNVAAYCTPENAYRLGTQSKAYFGVCPKNVESAFLSGLERGRQLRASPPQVWPYYQRMDEAERQLLAAGSDGERQQLRARLRDIEWWAIHIVNTSGTYSVDN